MATLIDFLAFTEAEGKEGLNAFIAEYEPEVFDSWLIESEGDYLTEAQFEGEDPFLYSSDHSF